MMKAEKNIPELRFPEFEGEWNEVKLDDISVWKSGGTPSKEIGNFWGGEIPWITAASMRGHRYSDSEYHVTDEGAKNGTTIVKKGTLLILVRGSMLFKRIPVGIAVRTVTFNQDVKAITFNSNTTPDFILNWILSKESKILNMVMETGIGAGKLDTADLKGLIVLLPILLEQQKIASFLASVDKRINLLTQKKEKLEQYKKGVMQKIFSQQMRFRDENRIDYPAWEEMQFGSLYRFLSTNSLSRDKLNYESGPVKNIHYGDIHTRYKSHFLIDKEIVPYINPDIDLRKTNSINYLQEGDLVIADASEDYADIGKSIEICSLNGQPVLAGLHTLQARRKDNMITIGYGGHMMKSPENRIQIQRIAQGTKVLSIAAIRLSEIKIQLPCRSEQCKISTFLSSIDDKINHLNSQIELTRKWKQGLLQKMFV